MVPEYRGELRGFTPAASPVPSSWTRYCLWAHLKPSEKQPAENNHAWGSGYSDNFSLNTLQHSVHVFTWFTQGHSTDQHSPGPPHLPLPWEQGEYLP